MGAREVGVFVIKMDVRLHVLSYPGRNEPFDGCLLLCMESLLFAIVSLPLRGEEVSEMAQPLTFSLDLMLPFTKTAQSVNVSCHPCISYGFYGSSYDVVHLEVFT